MDGQSGIRGLSSGDYRKVIDEAAIVSETDLKGVITYANRHFCRISGYGAEELIGKPHNIVRHPEMPPEAFREMWTTIRRGDVWRGVVKNRKKDGGSYVVQATVMPVLDDAGEIIRYVSVREDITGLVQAKERLQSEMLLIDRILDAQESIVAICHPELGLIRANRKFFRIAGYPDLESFKKEHRCVSDLFIEETGYLKPEGNGRWMEEILAAPEQTHMAKMRCGEEERILAMSVNEIHAVDEGMESFRLRVGSAELCLQEIRVVTLNDVTRLEQALLSAQAAEKAKEEFLANMSHEIRTPLNAILGFVGLLRERVNDPENRKYVEIIAKSGKTLLGIINDVLDLAKIQSGKFEIEEVAFNPANEIMHVFELFMANADEKGVPLFICMDAQMPRMVVSDPLRIRQVFSNLLSNAIKFTPAGKPVRVEVGYAGEALVFQVADEGIGIPEEKREKIFEAFSQSHRAVARTHGGTGLGLTISVRLARLMGGEITVSSEEGKGSRFTFRVPAPLSEAEEETEGPRFVQRLSGRVLVAEDNEANRFLIKVLLDKMGAEATVVEDGQEAVELYMPGRYDLILMDVNMPRMDGEEALRTIREREAANGWKPVPVVALTANALKGEKERLEELGMDGYLAKPIDPDRLGHVLKEWLRLEEAAEGEKKPMEQEKVTLEAIGEKTGLGPEDTVTIVGLFRTSTGESLANVAQGVEEGDWDRVYRAWHKIAGSTANMMGLPEITRLAKEAEILARDRKEADHLEYRRQVETFLEKLPDTEEQ